MTTPDPISPPPDRIDFVPSRVEGAEDVVRVVLTSRGLELWTSEGCRTVSWVSMDPSPLSRWLRRAGLRTVPMCVANRDWFHPPAERFFRFFTTPRITVYLPDEPRETDYANTFFVRIQTFLCQNGLTTNDLG